MERDNDIINDYRNGMAPKDIADAHHLSLTRTYVILRKYPDYKRYERRTVSCYTERNKNIAAQYNAGIPVRQIAKGQNLSRARIYVILANQVDGSKQARAVAKARQARLAKRNKQMIEMAIRNPDMSVAAIARHYGILSGRAYGILHEAGVFRRKDGG